jgi:hypothetical protein
MKSIVELLRNVVTGSKTDKKGNGEPMVTCDTKLEDIMPGAGVMWRVFEPSDQWVPRSKRDSVLAGEISAIPAGTTVELSTVVLKAVRTHYKNTRV